MKVEGAYLSYVTETWNEVYRSNTKYINSKKQYGYNREEDTPVPIPNTEVKLFIADGT